MANCLILIEYNGDIESLFNLALNESRKYDAKIHGNSKLGNFEIKILELFFKGDYKVLGNVI